MRRRRGETTRGDDDDVGESLCIPISSISSPRSFVCDPRVVRACVSSRARARECHIAQTRKPLKNARETALFGAHVPARRDVARFVSRARTLARAPYTFSRASLVRARSHARGEASRALFRAHAFAWIRRLHYFLTRLMKYRSTCWPFSQNRSKYDCSYTRWPAEGPGTP